jgi:hypothetical protein
MQITRIQEQNEGWGNIYLHIGLHIACSVQPAAGKSASFFEEVNEKNWMEGCDSD